MGRSWLKLISYSISPSPSSSPLLLSLSLPFPQPLPFPPLLVGQEVSGQPSSATDSQSNDRLTVQPTNLKTMAAFSETLSQRKSLLPFFSGHSAGKGTENTECQSWHTEPRMCHLVGHPVSPLGRHLEVRNWHCSSCD